MHRSMPIIETKKASLRLYSARLCCHTYEMQFIRQPIEVRACTDNDESLRVGLLADLPVELRDLVRVAKLPSLRQWTVDTDEQCYFELDSTQDTVLAHCGRLERIRSTAYDWRGYPADIIARLSSAPDTLQQHNDATICKQFTLLWHDRYEHYALAHRDCRTLLEQVARVMAQWAIGKQCAAFVLSDVGLFKYASRTVSRRVLIKPCEPTIVRGVAGTDGCKGAIGPSGSKGSMGPAVPAPLQRPPAHPTQVDAQRAHIREVLAYLVSISPSDAMYHRSYLMYYSLLNAWENAGRLNE